MRTRIRTILDSSVPTGNPLLGQREHLVPPGPPDPVDQIWTQATPVLMDYEEELITDDPSSGRHLKECLHTREKFHRSGIDYETLENDVHGDGSLVYRYLSTGANCHWYNWGHYGRIRGGNVSVSFPIELDHQVRRLAHRFYALNEVDNLTNIVESPSLITGLRSFLVEAKKSIQLPRKVYFNKLTNIANIGRKVKIAPKALAKALSGAHLYYSFGIAPLVGDMKKILASVTEIDRQLKKHRDHAGKTVSLHSTVEGELSLHDLDGGYGDPSQTGKFWSTQILGSKPKRIVTVRGLRIKRYETELFQELDFRLRKFLTNGPASFVWERIPYSFVVDWFVDLSGVVDALDRFITRNPANIKETCYSIGYNAVLPVRKFPQMPAWPNSSSDWTITALNEISYYQRMPITSDPSIGLSGRFGKKQAGLSASLLTQIVSNLRRGR